MVNGAEREEKRVFSLAVNLSCRLQFFSKETVIVIVFDRSENIVFERPTNVESSRIFSEIKKKKDYSFFNTFRLFGLYNTLKLCLC